MWPFGPKRVSDLPETAERRLADVESTLRTLKTEWYDVLDRLERIAGRLAKRDQREAPVLQPHDGQARGTPAPPASRALADVMKRRRM